MAEQILSNESLQGLLAQLMLIGQLHGPTLNEQGVSVFSRITSFSELNLEYQRTLIPPKKYLLPPKTTILNFAPGTGYTQTPPPEEKLFLFGLHVCDLASIAYLDRVFLADRPDPLYEARRRALTLIGISCEADEYCFCGETGVDLCSVQYDLFLTKTEGGFAARTGSELGESLLTGISLAEEEQKSSTAPVVAAIASRIDNAVQNNENFEGNRLWDDFAERCLSCGACSLCCPTCYCLDVREYGRLDGQGAERIQEWDNCLFKSHGEVAGGINFRKTRKDRFHYRFLHKYLGFGPLKNIVSCVGCGRCREVCPVKIDLLELFRES